MPGAVPVNRSIDQETGLVNGRTCDSCTLCCKLLSIQELAKPRGEWCTHCDPGVGCGIYTRRPSECRQFNCGYRSWPVPGEHWFPANCGMVIVLDNDGNRLAIHVDPARPEVWLEQPFYADIKEWGRLVASGKQVVVCIGTRHIVILPDEDVDLGPIADDECVVTGEVIENGRRRKVAMKMRADDPRLEGKWGGMSGLS